MPKNKKNIYYYVLIKLLSKDSHNKERKNKHVRCFVVILILFFFNFFGNISIISLSVDIPIVKIDAPVELLQFLFVFIFQVAPSLLLRNET
jgi:hypothetical protein